MKKIIIGISAVVAIVLGIYSLNNKPVENAPSMQTTQSTSDTIQSTTENQNADIASVTATTSSDSINDGQYCFSFSQAATPTEPYAVEENIILNVVGNSVVGTKTGTQNGPDMTNGYQGDLKGNVDGDMMELVFSYTVEGSENKELEVYKFGSNELIKMRWPLEESAGMLVPIRTGDLKMISYTRVACE